jgi:hypothetical protein
MQKNNITKKQHYIPQVYLRGFSREYKPLKKFDDDKRYTVFSYDLLSNKQIEQAIPIKSICYEKSIYELRDQNGDLINVNYLEKTFGILEIEFSKYRRKLERKAYYKENLKIRYFLDRDEREFWQSYITFQILRLPQIVKGAKEEAEKVFSGIGDKYSTYEIDSFAKMSLFPFFREIGEESIEYKVFSAIFDSMDRMNIAVGVNKNGRLITSDKTISIDTEIFPCDEYKSLFFPITSTLCVMFAGEEYKDTITNNTLIEIDDEWCDDINRSIVNSSFGKVYSSYKLSGEYFSDKR